MDWTFRSLTSPQSFALSHGRALIFTVIRHPSVFHSRLSVFLQSRALLGFVRPLPPPVVQRHGSGKNGYYGREKRRRDAESALYNSMHV